MCFFCQSDFNNTKSEIVQIIRSISLSYHLSIQTVDGETATLHLSKVGHYQYIKSSIINPLVPYQCPYELL